VCDIAAIPLVILTESQAVKSQIAEAQKIASGSGSEQDIAEAKIELEVSCFFPIDPVARADVEMDGD
jgi:hypothetical protein